MKLKALDIKGGHHVRHDYKKAGEQEMDIG